METTMTDNNARDINVRNVVDEVRKKANEEELEKYIKEEMSKLRFDSMATGLKVCAKMVLDICENESLGMREKLREIKRFCKTGLDGKENR